MTVTMIIQISDAARTTPHRTDLSEIEVQCVRAVDATHASIWHAQEYRADHPPLEFYSTLMAEASAIGVEVEAS